MKAETICRELPCDDYATERPRFFPRQLITPDDLNLVLEHYRTKLRRHNRLLHGWGVVCGAKVCPVPNMDGGIEAWKVKVTPGYILGPYGDEIRIDCERTVDLRTKSITGVTGEPCVEVPDPWCSEVFVPCEESGCRYLAVKYMEIMTRPVRVQPVGCGCDDTQCEYSRWRDGYEIKCLNRCPESHENPPAPRLEGLIEGALPECPPCPEDPWVVLAKIDVGDDGTIEKIDNCSCRRLVISFGHFWWQREKCLIGITKVDPDKVTMAPEDQEIPVVITGSNFDPKARVNWGCGITATQLTVKADGTQLQMQIKIIKDTGPRVCSLTVTNPDCSSTTKPDAITIVPG